MRNETVRSKLQLEGMNTINILAKICLQGRRTLNTKNGEKNHSQTAVDIHH